MTCSREVVLEFMERAGHDSIGEVKSFFDTISVMDINVDIKDSLESFEELKDGQHTIVDIAKS